MKLKLVFAMLIFTLASCKKDWLSEKRDISVIVPTTLKDLQLLLNNDFPLNYDARGLTESSCDDFDVTTEMYQSMDLVEERNAIIWKKELYEGVLKVRDWDEAYRAVAICNVVLKALEKNERNSFNASEYDSIKGSALFFRARAYLNLVMTFSKYYDPTTASTDLGIPLKLSDDINEKISRASVEEVYDHITTDLSLAAKLLPAKAERINDASKVACYGLLARCFLFMDKYEKALEAAEQSYSLNNTLVDFNTLDATSELPFSLNFAETHIFSTIVDYYNFFPGYANVNKSLYDSYDENDLRKTIFFEKRAEGGIDFKGSYMAAIGFFGGTATDEIVLIKAECKARKNDVVGALSDLNLLLAKRFKTGSFIPVTASNAESALTVILAERRKELTRRGLRWQDLKRLNRVPQYAKTLQRTIDGNTYTLPPNDPRYIISIPNYIIQFNQIPQNIR